ncbi:Plasma membrane sulfite pump involved in sulfite metabolism [Savitreella phatthalungensis]
MTMTTALTKGTQTTNSAGMNDTAGGQQTSDTDSVGGSGSGGFGGEEVARSDEKETACESLRWPETRRRLKNFTLSWFSVCMGTGIVSEVLFLMPYRGPGQRTAGVVFFLANILLFTIFTIATIIRYIMFPKIPLLLIKHPSESLYVGTVPMAWATIVNMAVYTGSRFGTGVVTVAWVGWWADVVMSVATCFLVTYAMISRHVHASVEETSSLWLLPIVSAPVASTAAAVLIPHLSDGHAFTTLLVGYALWGFGVLLAAMILMLYLQRLIFHHLPPRQLIVSIWLPIGFLGQGVYAIATLGIRARGLFPKIAAARTVTATGLSAADAIVDARGGEILAAGGALIGLILWGFSMWWLVIAIFAVLDHLRGDGFPFTMGWWSFTFPLGSLATGTLALGQAFGAPFFLVLGEIMSWAVVLLYTLVMALTLRQAWKGTLFYAPCLRDAPTSGSSSTPTDRDLKTASI